MGDQPSLDEDVVVEDIDDIIVWGVDLPTHLPATTHDVLRVQRKSGFAAPALQFHLFLCEQLLPLPTQRRLSWTSQIIFNVLGVQFIDLQVFLKVLISIEL